MSQFSYNLNWFADFMAYVIRKMFPWEVRINQSDAYSLEQTFRKFEKRVTRSVYEVVYRGVEFPSPATPLKTPCRGRLCSQTSFETDLISLLLSKLEPISDVTLQVKRKNLALDLKTHTFHEWMSTQRLAKLRRYAEPNLQLATFWFPEAVILILGHPS